MPTFCTLSTRARAYRDWYRPATGLEHNYVSTSPPSTNVTMMAPQTAEQQRQAQRQVDKTQQQQYAHDDVRDATMSSPVPMNQQQQSRYGPGLRSLNMGLR